MKITAEQRDALYDEVLERLGAIDDIRMAASRGMYEMADRFAREYTDELRLVLDDLGWGDGPGDEEIELTVPADVRRRLFTRFRDGAAGERSRKAADWAESRKLEERNRLVAGISQAVLDDLGEGQA